jgi:hypothetical protein
MLYIERYTTKLYDTLNPNTTLFCDRTNYVWDTSSKNFRLPASFYTNIARWALSPF